MILRWPERSPLWIDLVDPTPQDIALVEGECGARIPTRDELLEIEATSRVRVENGRLYLSAPLIAGIDEHDWRLSPVGFVVCADFLITVRFDPLPAFDCVHERLESVVAAPEIFVRLIEEVVDRAADHLERAADIVTDTGKQVFRDPNPRERHLSRDADKMRSLMVTIGRASERMARVRYTFLSIARLAGFAGDKGRDWLSDDLRARLEAARHDIASLDEFETSLSGRVQLLQDAAANFVGIEQNDVVRLLTIVSVVGVPPVLVVGVYGMNFKFMPELQWHYGYPFAMLLVVLSAVVPLLWFKLRGWL